LHGRPFLQSERERYPALQVTAESFSLIRLADDEF